MNFATVIFTIFVTYICVTDGKPVETITDAGDCKPVAECPSLLEIYKKPDKTQADIDLLATSKCGVDGDDDTLKVQCPESCTTTQGEPGKCVTIYSCPQLSYLLKRPITPNNHRWIIYNVLGSGCKGDDSYYVCCGAPRDTDQRQKCPAAVSALPPKPWTECCGLDVNIEKKVTSVGKTSNVDSSPWLAIIEYIQGSDLKLLCGGSLISGRYVLTAAHCVAGDILKIGTPKNVRLGEYDIKNDGKDCAPVEGGEDCTDGTVIIPIDQTISHPDYNTNSKHSPNDIALVRLQKTAPYTDFIRPICLPSQDMTIVPFLPAASFTTILVSGWGLREDAGSNALSDVKKEVGLRFVERNVCELVKNITLTSRQICASGKESCKGDSGGPLMLQTGRTWELLGVASFGTTPCGQPNVSEIYTKVYDYKDWIGSVIVA